MMWKLFLSTLQRLMESLLPMTPPQDMLAYSGSNMLCLGSELARYGVLGLCSRAFGLS